VSRVGREELLESLRNRIVAGLHVGRYTGGERLPNTRALAAEFGVNERVVLAALRMLADEGFIDLRPRSGAYVVPPHPAGGGSLPDLGVWLVNMLLQARARGLAPKQVSEYVRRCLETRRVRAACIECNLDHMHLLCSELADDHGYVSEGAELDDVDDAEPPIALRRADVLVTTTFHTARVQAAAERLGKPWITIALRPDVLDEVSRCLAKEPVYYVATDARVEPKLRRMLAPIAPVENLRVMIVGHDDLDHIPAQSPTFVMTSARTYIAERYGQNGGPGKPIFHPPRSFSDATARELLAFLVRANMSALSAGPV
jgi:DNA-binding transcriptional regulator YhcF (GntR family)